eukprot:4706506-Prymnesium_polylepis.1
MGARISVPQDHTPVTPNSESKGSSALDLAVDHTLPLVVREQPAEPLEDGGTLTAPDGYARRE